MLRCVIEIKLAITLHERETVRADPLQFYVYTGNCWRVGCCSREESIVDHERGSCVRPGAHPRDEKLVCGDGTCGIFRVDIFYRSPREINKREALRLYEERIAVC